MSSRSLRRTNHHINSHVQREKCQLRAEYGRSWCHSPLRRLLWLPCVTRRRVLHMFDANNDVHLQKRENVLWSQEIIAHSLKQGWSFTWMRIKHASFSLFLISFYPVLPCTSQQLTTSQHFCVLLSPVSGVSSRTGCFSVRGHMGKYFWPCRPPMLCAQSCLFTAL